MPGGLVRWEVDEETQLRAVAGNFNTNGVQTSLSNFVPPTASGVLLSAVVGNGSATEPTLCVSSADDGLITVGSPATAGQMAVGPTLSGSARRMRDTQPVTLGPTKAIRHGQTGQGGTHDIYVVGYYEAAS